MEGLVEEMTPWLSNKFKWLSLIATWAVVCIHSRTDRWVPCTTDWANTFQETVAPMFDFAVPLFFVISGYMFVSSYQKYGWGGLLKRKVGSLYIPAIIWTLVGLLICLPIRLYSGNSIPGVWRFVGAPFLWVEGCEGQHFWYVRSLLIMFAFAPIVMFVARRWWLTVPVMLAATLFTCPFANSGYFNLRLNTTVLFFVAGAFVAANMNLRDVICTKMSRGGGVMVIIGLLLNLTPYSYLVIMGQIMILWGLYDVIDSRVKIPQMPSCLNVLFFVYCLHLIVICWVSGVLKLSLGTSPVARTISYITLGMTFWLDVLIANLVLKYFPRLYAVLAGGRVK